MQMKKMMGIVGACCLVVAGLQGISRGEEKATPAEVVQKVKAGVEFLKTSGEAGLADFNKPDGPWVWKDTYVVVENCEEGTMAAHPTMPKLLGKNTMGLKDIKGNMFFVQFCDAGKKPEGGWVEYWWPKPGQQEPMRKVGYALQVPNTSLVLTAGIYDEQISMEELQKSIGK